jgi:hypothetical protein
MGLLVILDNDNIMEIDSEIVIYTSCVVKEFDLDCWQFLFVDNVITTVFIERVEGMHAFLFIYIYQRNTNL